jgi:hypothetical protein
MWKQNIPERIGAWSGPGLCRYQVLQKWGAASNLGIFYFARLDTPFGYTSINSVHRSASAKNGHRVRSVSRCPVEIGRLPKFKAAP